jgi:ATP adenylyltransferase
MLYNVDAARSDEQRVYMQQLEREGKCLFCREWLTSDPHQVVIHDLKSWMVTANRFPYAGSSSHFLLIPDSHVLRLTDLDDAMRAEFWDALDWTVKSFELTDYGVGVRNGDPARTGGTISHLHVHLFSPAGDPPLRMRFN